MGEKKEKLGFVEDDPFRYKLKDLAIGKLAYGSGAAAIAYDGCTRYVRITDIDDNGKLNADIASPNSIDERYLLNDGDLLLARTGATVGKSFLYHHQDGKCIYAGFLIRVIPNQEVVLPEYLYFFTKSPQYKRFVQSSMKVVAQPNINAQQYGDLELHVPNKKLQEEIVEKLQGVSHLIDLRKAELNQLDTLIKARFVEMFGDPINNEKNWNFDTLSNICEAIYGGGTPSKSHPEYFEGDIPWVSPKDMKFETITDSIDHITPEAVENSSAKMVPAGAVLMVIRSGILKHTLPVAIARVDLTVNQDMKVFVTGDKITSEFLMYYFKAIEPDVLSGVRGVTADNIDFKEFQNREIVLPPIEVQNKFVSFVAQVDKSKFVREYE